MPLSQFVEPIESSPSSFKAYRMDSRTKESDMRRAAKLGTCECCDYVTVSNDQQSVILIEETNLASTITDFKQKYDYLNDDDQTDLLYDEILKENRLKMYGSMLVLCRLSSSRADVKAFLPENRFQFWLVATEDSSDSVMVMDNLTDRDRLKGFLKSPLTKEMMNVVDIIPSTELDKKLFAQAIQIA